MKETGQQNKGGNQAGFRIANLMDEDRLINYRGKKWQKRAILQNT